MDYVISCYSKCPVHFGCSIVRQSQFDQSFDLEHALFHVWNMDLSLNFFPFFFAQELRAKWHDPSVNVDELRRILDHDNLAMRNELRRLLQTDPVFIRYVHRHPPSSIHIMRVYHLPLSLSVSMSVL